MAGAITARFCQNVKEIMRSRGMTQSELGEALGVTHQTVSTMLCGKHSPTLDKVEEVAEALGIDAQALVMQHLMTSS